MCDLCPLGWESNLGSGACHQCVAGQVSISEAAPCQLCLEGKFSNVAGGTECLECPARGAQCGETGTAEIAPNWWHKPVEGGGFLLAADTALYECLGEGMCLPGNAERTNVTCDTANGYTACFKIMRRALLCVCNGR